MEIKVLLFAILREYVGESSITVNLSRGTDISNFLIEIESQHTILKGKLDSVLVAINEEYADQNRVIDQHDILALIPPVSGGALSKSVNVSVSPEILDPEKALSIIKADVNGAELIFTGVVRNHNQGRKVLFLEYEAYPKMAEKMLERIGAETVDDHDISGIVLWHRTGHLEIGETSLLIAVTSAHRAAAFDACRDAVEKVKRLVPVWKKEVWETGYEWLKGAG
jgi:molybdopterin synthase catalytic subunit/molybdopterin converting factor small subunit